MFSLPLDWAQYYKTSDGGLPNGGLPDSGQPNIFLEHFAATKKQQTNQLPFAAKFGGWSKKSFMVQGPGLNPMKLIFT